MGHDVTVITVGDGPQQEERNGYILKRCPAKLSLIGNDIAPGVWRHLRDAGSYDVVHAHSHLYFSTNIAAIRRHLGSTPLAITNHGLYSQDAPKWLFDWYLKTVGQATFNSADTIFCYTEEDEQRVRRIGVTTPIEVIHNGIDTERFTPNGTSNDSLLGDPAILFVGRLVDGKNPADAIEVLARLREYYSESGLTFCGKGPLHEALKQRATELGVAEHVTFLGHVPYDEMPAVYRASDALLLTSWAEGVPRVVLEAMASNVPVVVSELEHVTPVVGDGGVTAPVGDIQGFVNALVEVLSEERTPRSRIERHYSWQQTAAQTTAALESLLDE
jgi:glycosyltransferase involved in cell wall biosynthesis